MDANQNTKKKLFICKFCNKKFPCGKSLGGHIRIHFNGNANSVDAEEEADYTEASGKSAGYGLRENPKKTRKLVSDSNQRNLVQAKVCKECGREFQSMKALCGHMASHSKTSLEDQSETTEKPIKEDVFYTQSDSETSSAPSKRRRSTRMRHKTFDVYSTRPNACVSDMSDDNQREQQEVAMCLMMLSKDSGFKGCFTTSDRNSVFVDTNSSPKLRISVKNVYNANGTLENSDSGYFRLGPKKVDPKCSVDSKFKRQKLGYEDELDPRLSRFRGNKTELGKDVIERGKNNESYKTDGYESNETEHVPNRKRIQSCSGKSPIVQKQGLKKGKVHECPFCYKVFRSGQALGGHKRSHFVGGSEDATVVIDHQVQVPEVSMSALIDLNFPPPLEEDTNDYYLSSW